MLKEVYVCNKLFQIKIIKSYKKEDVMMKSTVKRGLSLFLCLVILLQVFPLSIVEARSQKNNNGISLRSINPGDTPVATYKFYESETAEDPFYTIALKDGESFPEGLDLGIPAAAEDDKVFAGWKIEGEDALLDISQPVEVTTSGEVKV